MKRAAVRPLEVSYFYAGRKQQADFMQCLSTLTEEFNKHDVFGVGATLDFKGMDVLGVDGSVSSLSPSLRRQLIAGAVECDLHIVAIDCCAFSRARHSHTPGPKPLINLSWPRGISGLSPSDQSAVDSCNIACDFAAALLQAAAEAGCICFFAFPEGLGSHKEGLQHQFGVGLLLCGCSSLA